MEDEIVAARRDKAQRVKKRWGIDPFLGQDFSPTQRLGEIRQEYGSLTGDELKTQGIRVRVAGRMVSRRDFGKAGFLNLLDQTGTIQVYCRRDRLASDDFELYELLDIGDFIGVDGILFRTRTGELTVEAEKLFFLSKALRDLPEKWHGLADIETRYRRRYLDLLANQDSRARFLKRTEILDYLRGFLKSRGYLEVETPILHLYPTGARARPFNTHHYALDLPLVLRIAPELYLKRLVVGCFDRVFELGRAFRNEGLSTQHNPEFTLLEWYEAFSTPEKMMDMIEDLLRGLARKISGGETLTYQGESVDLNLPFARLSMEETLRRYLDFSGGLEHPEPLLRFALSLSSSGEGWVEDFCRSLEFSHLAELLFRWLGKTPATPEEALGWIHQESRKLGEEGSRASFLRAVKDIPYADPRLPAGVVFNGLFDKFVVEKLRSPTFVYDFPLLTSPLASRYPPPRDHLCPRFELFIFGREIANGFQELNDPLDQRERFLRQEALRAYGDLEAMQLDEDYIRALEHGLPPTVGVGMGVDRLVMLFTDAPSIRDVILFPLLKPRP